ncbi:hypothetical protein [Aliikangiella coralliicola]|uniref:Uncharacterized protein n=1 Tax=Aliikangiella coralliicola TaxID=2592383 RepID=A0A545UDD1_9GAMM|nr:hypothetical protein [Aliikangiella coralliicola]TQV87482.1 hypothetical protein FLL46_11435 [Aliikangiella coralliicola]
MILNRKSAKKTSRISLLIAMAMLSTIFAVLHTQGYQVEHIAENGMQVCKAGVVDLFTSLLW